MDVNTNYIEHWNEKFLAGDWGRYPPEDLVRFIGRNYKKVAREQLRVLEVGCGPGANMWFLHREGYQVAGIDGSSAAVELASKRLEIENRGLNKFEPDLRVGNFSTLPWEDNSFDVVIDIFSIYANTSNIINKTLAEVHRVLKPGGRFYSKLWGTETTGFGEGDEVERYTFDNIPSGPCCNMGVTHFFDEAEIAEKFHRFELNSLDKLIRTDKYSDSVIEELACQFTKPEAG